MKHWKPALAILAALYASLAVAEDFKTVNGKEYKNATTTRVEPDGLVIKFSGGMLKIPFTELPKGKRFIVHADEKLSAFVDLERVTRESFCFSNFGACLRGCFT